MRVRSHALRGGQQWGMEHTVSSRFDRVDRAISRGMRAGGEPMLRFGLGVVFVWFGVLKPLGLSPAAELLARTVYWGVDPTWFVPLLGWWEVMIGVCLIDPGRWLRLGSIRA